MFLAGVCLEELKCTKENNSCLESLCIVASQVVCWDERLENAQ